jgi:hypothetical protein
MQNRQKKIKEKNTKENKREKYKRKLKIDNISCSNT